MVLAYIEIWSVCPSLSIRLKYMRCTLHVHSESKCTYGHAVQ